MRQGTLVQLTPTVIPHAAVGAARLAASCLTDVSEQQLRALEVCCACRICMPARLIFLSRFDFLEQIGTVIAAAQDIKNAHGCTYDAWEVNEPQLKFVRHVKTEKEQGNVESMPPRHLPAQRSRLTGERVTYMMHDKWSTVTYCHHQG